MDIMQFIDGSLALVVAVFVINVLVGIVKLLLKQNQDLVDDLTDQQPKRKAR